MEWLCLWLTFSVFLASAMAEGYLGCFKDSNDRMFGHMRDYPDSLTPQVCIDYCNHTGYAFAGLQYRSQCFCGDDEPNIKLKADEDDCGFRCSGDNTQKCGGNWRNSVYKAGNIVRATIAVIGYDYLGCYRDQDSPRLLQGIFKDFGNYLTPLQCVEFCKERGYLYAGLQYRSQCFCGDQSLPDKKKVADSECNAKCSGDITTFCGGGWRNTIYATGLTQVSVVANIGYKYEGCYRDTEQRKLNSYMRDFGEDLVPDECVSLCKRYGYRFAGLQYRTQCFCGDNDLLPKDKRPEVECSYKCSGDVTKLCGGGYRNTIYNTGIEGMASVAATGYPYLGCFKDSGEKRRLKGDFKDFGQENTPEQCVSFCTEKGYKYAGMQYSSQCFCGDQTPKDNDKVDDKQCASRCSGESSAYCGAGWRNTIYDLQTANPTVAQFGDQYLGCYNDVIDVRRLDDKLENLGQGATPKKCIDLCYAEHLAYAGLQDSQYCYCGNDKPISADKAEENECNSRCLGDNSKICGGKFKNTIYKTNAVVLDNKTPTVICELSVTTINGNSTCKEQILFFEDFSGTSLTGKWSHVVRIAGEPDNEFVIFKQDPAHSYVENGHLIVKPTVMNDSFIQRGKVQLEGCTGVAGTEECEYQARIYLILPPVESARLNTKNSFSFRYGKVDIRAKLPRGDWLVPDLWLESKDNTYGPYYSSGRIRIGMSRGNNNSTLNGNDLSCKVLEVGVVMGVENNVREFTSLIVNSDECWSARYHEYSVVWTHNNISFLVDGVHRASMLKSDQKKLSEVVGFSNDISALWSVGSDIAPFDSDFYMTVGVSAGGVRNFPDGTTNAGKLKPWKNSEPKRILNFWKERQQWEPTWSDDSTLKIDYIRVTAI